jgi:phenylpropionate dioxygenase-like ring-hydroxylating dioxygenase large terminal subunit
MFLKNCWYVAAWEHELPATGPIGRQIIGEPVVLFRGEEGAVYALEDRCSHRRAPLSMGRIEDGGIRCMYHGLLFGTDGTCREVPGSTKIPPRTSVRTYPVLVQDGWIWVWMGELAMADPARCPRAFGLEDRRWKMRAGQIDYRASYMLVNDNLCDLSHLDFVHETTLGAVTGGGWSDDLPQIIALERGLRIERWHIAKPTSPTNPSLVDTWSTYDYLVPGIFIMENRSYPHGMAQKLKFAAPTEEPMTHRVEQQAVTPIDANRTRYFFATGFDAALPEKLLEPIFATVMAAFAEDRAIIEAQQLIWEVTPADKPMAFIAHDKAPAMFRQILSRLIKAECKADDDEAALLS